MVHKYQFGEVYLMNFDGLGSEQRGWRPGLVFQNNTGNLHSPNIIALPLTSSLKKLGQPTHVLLPAAETGLLRDSVVLCENPQRMSKDRIGSFVTRIPNLYLGYIAEASVLASSAISYLDVDTLIELRKRAIELNAV